MAKKKEQPEQVTGVMVKEVDGLRIRRLGNKDTIKLARIMVRHAKQVAPVLAENKGSKEDTTSLGITVIATLVDSIGDEVVELVADIAGMTKEEFENAPFDTLPKIIETVVKENDIEGFSKAVKNLAKTLGLFKKTTGSAAPGSES